MAQDYKSVTLTGGAFQWDDPLLIEGELTTDERMIRDAAREYAQEKLLPRIRQWNRDGAFDPVIAAEGLLGVVRSVGNGSSVVMTWAHPEFRVSAFTADGRIHGLVMPAGAGEGAEPWLELRGVPYRDTIAMGAVVLSSGLGGVYPKGIPIGSVVGIAREQAGWERVYRVRPAANPSAASHVLVLTAPRETDLSPAFPSDSILAALAADSAARRATADSLLRMQVADSAVRAYIAAQAARTAPSGSRTPVPVRRAPRPAAPDTTRPAVQPSPPDTTGPR